MAALSTASECRLRGLGASRSIVQELVSGHCRHQSDGSVVKLPPLKRGFPRRPVGRQEHQGFAGTPLHGLGIVGCGGSGLSMTAVVRG